MTLQLIYIKNRQKMENTGLENLKYANEAEKVSTGQRKVLLSSYPGKKP